jgi:septum formation protein
MKSGKLPIILASQSPRRVQLMREAGFDFEVLAVDVEESHDPVLTPQQLTTQNALLKARAGAILRPDALVIGADTLVYLDQQPLGKPRDLIEAEQMLRRLSGRAHHVCTGVAMAKDGGNEVHSFAVISDVVFRSLTDAEIRAYYALVNPLDKAGAYAIQEHGERIIESTQGSWSNIMGLPMEQLCTELNQVLGH